MRGPLKIIFYKIPLLLLLLSKTSICVDINYQLVKDYLLYTNVRIVLFATDDNPVDIIEESRHFHNDDIWLNHWNAYNASDIVKFNYEHFFERSTHQICIVINLDGNQTQAILNEISQRKMFHFERNWIMFGSSHEQVVDILSKENVNVDAQVATIVSIGDNEYRIKDVYSPSHTRHSSLRVDEIGSWSKTTGLKMNENKTKIERRKNLDGVTFPSVIAIPKLPPNTTLMEHLNSNENTHLDSSSKNNYRIYQFLTEMYNFKMAIRRSAIWGALKPNGTWIGALGLINRSEVDICISGVRWEVDRYGAFEQTTEGYYVRVLILFRHPRSTDATSIFVAPFSTMVWCLIVVFGFIISVESHLVDFIRKFMKLTKLEAFYNNSLFMICGILFQQASDTQPSHVSSRVLFTTALIFALIIYQFYSSFIVGALLIEPPKTIKTMQHLYNSKLDLAIDDIPYVQDVFKYVGEEWTVKLYQRVMAQPKPLVPLYTGLNMVKKGRFAMNTDANYAYKILKTILTDREACDLQEINFVPKIPTGSPLPNKSPLKEMIKIGIRKLYETGMLAYLWKMWIGQKPKCEHSVDVIAVDLMHFSSAFYVLVFGVQISIGFLLWELFSFKRSARRRLCNKRVVDGSIMLQSLVETTRVSRLQSLTD